MIDDAAAGRRESDDAPPSRPALRPSVALTKTCNPADLSGPLAFEAAVVSTVDLSAQHPMRAWEYALALHAIKTWARAQTSPHAILFDVGGAGSPFATLVTQFLPGTVAAVVDPAVNHTIEDSPGHAVADVVTAISVLEHVERWKDFLRACSRHLRPGGLLVLTVDYWDCEGPDTAHYHWMRKRIYNRHSLTDVITFCREKLGCRRVGETDWTYHGAQVFDYTFCSVVLQKDI